MTLAVVGGWQEIIIQLQRVFRSLLTWPKAQTEGQTGGQTNGWTAGQMYDCRVTLVLWIRFVMVQCWCNPHSHHHVCMWVTASQANVIKWVHILLCLLRRQCGYWDAERVRNEEEWEIMSQSLKCEISQTHLCLCYWILLAIFIYIYFLLSF